MITMAAAPLGRFLRSFAILFSLSLIAACSGTQPSRAAPYAAYVMDARTGETLYEENSEQRLHPASLTKMMTLYIAFEEIERGNLSLDSMITVSKNAAAQPPSRLGLKAGQKIQLRYLIRAAAVKSANDAAQAIGDSIGGNQAQFAERMTRTAQALGMRDTTFKNANGLTAKGHLSTPKDMSILGRHLFYDFPQYYNIFSRRTTDAGLATVANTNRKFLDAYKGADGIKTGYTEPAGFNLTASAERGGVRIIATVFGGKSTADRNAKVAKLLDLGFDRAGKGGAAVPPAPPVYSNADDELVASAPVPEIEEAVASASKTVRVAGAVTTSPRPMARPDLGEQNDTAEAAEVVVAALADDIAGALAEATGNAAVAPEPEPAADAAAAPAAAQPSKDLPFAVASAADVAALDAPAAAPQAALDASAPRPAARPDTTPTAPAALEEVQLADLAAPPAKVEPAAPKRQAPIYDAAPTVAAATPTPVPAKGEVVTRVSTSGAKHWGINVGRFKSNDTAQRILLKMQLVESATLGDSLRKVTQKGGGYDANFLGLSQEAADLACRRLTARQITCITLGP